MVILPLSTRLMKPNSCNYSDWGRFFFPDFVDDVVNDDDYYFVVSIGNRGLSQTGKSELGTFVREKGEEPMMEFSFLFECCARKLYPWEITRNFGPLG